MKKHTRNKPLMWSWNMHILKLFSSSVLIKILESQNTISWWHAWGHTLTVYVSITKSISLRHQTPYPGKTLKLYTWCWRKKITCLGQFPLSLTIKPRYCILCSQRALMRVSWNNRLTSQEIVGSPRVKLLIFKHKNKYIRTYGLDTKKST